MPNNKQINVSAEAYSAILSAIEQVFANTGKKPKYSEVQAIYKTSNSYIQHVMTEWLKEHQDELNSPSTQVKKPITLDDETIKALSNSFVVEVQKAKDEADADLEQLRRSLYETRDDALDEMKAQMNIADERLDEINELTATKIAQAQKVLELESEVSNWKLKHDDLLAVNKRQSDDIQRTESRNSDLDADLTDTRKQLNTAQSEATSYKMQFNEVTKRAERLTTELDNKSKQLNERDNTISKLSNESLDDKRSIAILEGNNAALKQSNDSLEQKLSKSSNDLKQAHDDNAALKGDIATIKAENVALQTQYQDLSTKYSNTNQALELANEQIAALKQDNDRLKKSSN